MATIAERTYTFRAPGDLGSRIREASVILGELSDAASSTFVEKIAAELVLALTRDGARFRDIKENQSAFMRETIELLVGAVGKVASDLRYAGVYAEAAESQTNEEIEFRRAGRARVAKRWRDA